MAGILDWLSKPALADVNQSSQQAPNRLGLIGAGLQDAGAIFGSGQGGNMSAMVGNARALNERAALNAKIKAAYASGDRNALIQAVMDSEMQSPGSASHIFDAMKSLQPVARDPNATLVDPLSNKVISQGKPKLPPGYEIGPDGTPRLSAWYLQGSGELSGAKRAPKALKASVFDTTPGWKK